MLYFKAAITHMSHLDTVLEEVEFQPAQLNLCSAFFAS